MSLPVEAGVEPLVGWRGWKLLWPGYIVSNEMVWGYRQRTEAVCAREKTYRSVACVKTPGETCSCGIYAFNAPYEMQEQGYVRSQEIYGEVWLWGKVIQHERGFKAEFAYPKKFYATQSLMNRKEDLVLRVAFNYGVEFELIKDDHPLLNESPEAMERKRVERANELKQKQLATIQKRMKTTAYRKGVETKLASQPATKPGFKNLLEELNAEVNAEVKRRLGK